MTRCQFLSKHSIRKKEKREHICNLQSFSAYSTFSAVKGLRRLLGTSS
jgi:hypothetical protein